ncbi:helix-turn-helix domain-containing protein [Streptomyces celluloflavus]|uniref:helix-turn-helix domain-containing protein n=1 Tax=Streptomyces celluloflavus TaxID=58344 RepID=UPI0036BF36EE
MPARKDIDGSVSIPAFYGKELRWKREAAGLTLQATVANSFYAPSYLSEIERGTRRMPLRLAIHVDRVLATDGYFERCCTDVQKAKRGGHAEYFADVAEMEQHAETIEEWAPMLIPGLLQTAVYARKVVRTGSPWLPPETVTKQVAARIERAEIWEHEVRPTFWGILHESLIRKPLLPPAQMAEQLTHVQEVIEASQGVLQILPENADAHPLMMGEMRIMTFSDAPPLIYTEGTHSGQLIDYPALVRDYRRSYDLLRAAALSPKASLAMIDAAAEDYRDAAVQQE